MTLFRPFRILCVFLAAIALCLAQEPAGGYTLADLPSIVSYYAANKAPVPSLHQNTELYPTGAYVWNELRFEFPNGKEYSLQLELVLADPSVGLVDLIRAGLVPGSVFTAPRYTPPAPVIVAPQPVDEVVGIPDTGHAGLFEPGPKASMQLFIGLSTAGANYTAKNGKQYRPVLINPGSMFATYDWALVQ